MKPQRGRTLMLLRVLVYLALVALGVVALQRVAVVIAPVATGLFLAYLLNPWVHRLERRGMPRSVGIAGLLVLFGGTIAVLAIAIPQLLSREVQAFSERWIAYQLRLETVILPWVQARLHLASTASIAETGSQIVARLASLLQGASGDMAAAAQSALQTATGLLRVFLAVLLTPVFAIYFLSDYPKLRDATKDLIPPRHRAIVVGLVSEVNHALASWVRGQLTVMLILGALYAGGLALTGIPLGVAIGLLTGLMAFVPYVGVIMGLVLALACALLDPHPASAIAGVLAVYGAVQALDALIVTPRVLGGRVGLSPVAVIFALTLGGELLGYAGVILAVPSAAVCKVLLRHALQRYRASALYTGQPALTATTPAPLTMVQTPPAAVVTLVPPLETPPRAHGG